MPPRTPPFLSCLRQRTPLIRQKCLYGRNPYNPATHRTLIAPPTPNSGPLMTRRSDRALPSITPSWRVWAKSLPIFVILITISALGIFNYQKSSSSIVASTLYALRTSEVGKKELGDDIYFRDMWPWIWGEMNQLHGRVNIHFGVKGTRGRGVMRFRSERRGRLGKVSCCYDLFGVGGC